MNATLPVLNVNIPNGAAAPIGPAPGPAPASGAKTKDFASVLGSTAKTADRKAAGPQAAQTAPVGQPVPVVGNPPPPLPAAVAADASAAAAAALSLAAAATPPPASTNSTATPSLSSSPSRQAATITAASADQAQLATQSAQLRQQAQSERVALATNAAAAAAGGPSSGPASGQEATTNPANALAAQDPASQPLTTALPASADDWASNSQVAAAKALAAESAAAGLAQAGANSGSRAARSGGASTDARLRVIEPASAPKSSAAEAGAAAAAAARSADTSPAVQAAASTDPTLSALGSSFGAQLQLNYTDSISGQSAPAKSGSVASVGAAASSSSLVPASMTSDAPAPAAAAVAPPQLGAFASALGVADKPGRDTSIAALGAASGAGAAASTAGPNGTDAGSAVAAASANQAAAATNASGSSSLAKIEAGINTPEFSQALADRVSYMAGNNLNGATLQVTPPQLGPIELRVSVENGHAQVWLSAHSPATLDALQSSTPKLREMLSSQGFAQVSVDVSQRSFQDRSAYPQNSQWTPTPDRDAAPAAAPISAGASPRAALGVVDAYA